MLSMKFTAWMEDHTMVYAVLRWMKGVLAAAEEVCGRDVEKVRQVS